MGECARGIGPGRFRHGARRTADRLDLRGGIPDASAFPRRPWASAARRAVLDAPASEFGYAPDLGSPALRETLADYLARTRGVVASEERHVLYAGTASKSLAPAVGLAWGVVPEWLLGALTVERRIAGSAADALNQRTLHAFMASHEYDRNVRRLRAEYRARRLLLESRVSDDLAGCRITGLAAGLHCLLELPAGTSETRVTEAAARVGLRFDGRGSFRLHGTDWRHPAAMVVGYGTPPPHLFDAAVELAIRAIRSVVDGVR